MRHVKNFFNISEETGDFKIKDEILSGFHEVYPEGTYILIEKAHRSIFDSSAEGSRLNAGLYEVNDGLITLAGTRNEEWRGKIHSCAVPLDFINLCGEIKAFSESPAGKISPYVSESVIGLHSYTKAAGADGLPAGWQVLFAPRLLPFKRVFHEVNI